MLQSAPAIADVVQFLSLERGVRAATTGSGGMVLDEQIDAGVGAWTGIASASTGPWTIESSQVSSTSSTGMHSNAATQISLPEVSVDPRTGEARAWLTLAFKLTSRSRVSLLGEVDSEWDNLAPIANWFGYAEAMLEDSSGDELYFVREFAQPLSEVPPESPPMLIDFDGVLEAGMYTFTLDARSCFFFDTANTGPGFVSSGYEVSFEARTIPSPLPGGLSGAGLLGLSMRRRRESA